MPEKITIESLGEKGTLLSEVLNTLFDGVYITDRRRRIIFWNKGAEEITGYSAEEVTGKYCRNNILNHIDENGKLMCRSACPLLLTIKTGKSVSEKVYPLHKSGHRIPVETHIAPLRNNKGEIIAGVEIFRDVSVAENYRILQEKFNALIKKYISSTTMEKIREQIESGSAACGDLKDLTILYLDIAGFTPFSETHSPEDIMRMLNEFFGLSEVITKKYQGDIDKFIGDAVMAVFIDANDAVAAAEEILRALKSLNEQREVQKREPINIRVGINSGKVVQGEIGTLSRKDLTVIGDAVNTAARIQQAAAVNNVCISEATWSRIRNPERFELDKVMALKGKKQNISVFKLKNG